MKQILTICFLAIASITSVQAQFQYGGGATLVLDNSQFGINGRAALGVSDDYKGVIGATFFFPKNDVSLFVMDFDVHYKLVNIGDRVRLHPFGGLEILTGAGDTDIGINIGAQFNVNIGDNNDIFIEPKFVINGLRSLVVTAGTMF